MVTFYICDTSQQASIGAPGRWYPIRTFALPRSLRWLACPVAPLQCIASRPTMYLLRDVRPLKQYLQSFIMMVQWSARLQVGFPVSFLSTSEISSVTPFAGASVMFAEGERFELPCHF